LTRQPGVWIEDRHRLLYWR